MLISVLTIAAALVSSSDDCRKIASTPAILQNEIYHASRVPGLKVLRPTESTHGISWVYGTTYLGLVAAYLNDWSDFDFNQSIINTQPVLVERYAGALEKIFKGRAGSIYRLVKSGFLPGKTSFSGEVVNPNPVEVVEEIKVPDALPYLLELERTGKLKIYRFPDRPPQVPRDDSDIIEKAVRWIVRKPTGSTYAQFVFLHPQLKARLDEALRQLVPGPIVTGF